MPQLFPTLIAFKMLFLSERMVVLVSLIDFTNTLVMRKITQNFGTYVWETYYSVNCFYSVLMLTLHLLSKLLLSLLMTLFFCENGEKSWL